MKILVASALMMTLAACGHATMRGSVVMKVSDTDANVCLGKGEVHQGSSVKLYRNICSSSPAELAAGPAGICKREPTGEGEVTRVINDHYSVVRFPSGTSFHEGDTVETSR